jgi:hypothetical protein
MRTKATTLINKCLKLTNNNSHQLVRVEQFKNTSSTHLVKTSAEGSEMSLNGLIQHQVHIKVHKLLPAATIQRIKDNRENSDTS